MRDRNKVICIIATILAIFLFAGFYVWNSGVEAEKTRAIEQKIAQYDEDKRTAEQKAAEIEKKREEITAVIPGVACWGDDFTYGLGGIEKSFPSVLARLMENGGYLMPVENLGIYDEDSLTVLGRANAIPFIVKDEKNIVGQLEKDNITISSLNGEPVDPLLHENNPGVNPVTIDGVEGTLYGGVGSENIEKVEEYFFEPTDEGTTMTISAGTPIVTKGEVYKDYVSVLSIGNNGGWNDDPAVLVEQQKRFVETRGKNKDKYIIIGLVDGDRASNADTDALMSSAFGSRFLNIREYICTEALKNTELSDEDKAAAEKGEIPECYRYKNRGLNDDAYELIGEAVFNKLEELGYIIK